MTAPTEREIREAIFQRTTSFHGDDPSHRLRQAVEEFAEFMTTPAYDVLRAEPEDRPGPDEHDPYEVWADLRISEARRLDEIAQAAINRALGRAVVDITDELVNAALLFVSEHPDAPRVKVPA
jgi:hypothetical protein